MNSDLYGPPSRIALVHPDPARSRGIAEALRLAGHRVRVVVPSPHAVEEVRQQSPDLVVLHESLAAEAAGRTLEPGVPLITLTEGGAAGRHVRCDAMLREPVDPEVVRVCAGGLLRNSLETRKLRRRVKDLGALYKLTWAFSLEGGAERLYGYLAEHTAAMLRADKGLVLTYDTGQRRIVARPPGYGLPADKLNRLSYPVDGESAGRWHFRKNGPLACSDAAGDPRLMPGIAAELGLRSVMVAPMARGSSIVGLLAVADRSDGRAFDEDDLNQLIAASSLAAVAVDNLASYETVRRANQSLQEFDRLKSEFLGMIAHDYRRPLNAIRGFAEIVLVDDPPQETVKNYMSAIIDESEGLARLADDTLLLTKLETANVEFRWSEVDLGTLAREVIPSGLTRHTVVVEVPPGMPPIVADAQRLRQVLSNLVSNAVKYSPGGGIVALRCHVQDDQVTFAVSDQGLGIPEDQQANLFQRFRRVQTGQHRAVSGTGLGLYISRLIVEGHGGRIWVESKGGHGSTFCVSLPLDARQCRGETQPAPVRAPAPKPASRPPGSAGPITTMFLPITGAVSGLQAGPQPATSVPSKPSSASPVSRPHGPAPPARRRPVAPAADHTGGEKRKSRRIRRRVPIRVSYQGGTLKTYTAVINRHGALIVSAVAIAPRTRLQITSLSTGNTAPFQVVRCGDQQAGLYGIGVQLEGEQDFWGRAYDPELTAEGQVPPPPG